MPSNYSLCGGCPYNNQRHLSSQLKSKVLSPLSIDKGKNAKVLLIFQAPGIDEWQGNTCSKKRIPIDSINPHSAAARMRNSMRRKNVVRSNYDITEAVQCYPGKKKDNRDRSPILQSKINCLQYLINDLSKKNYTKIIAFGVVAYDIASKAISNLNQKTVLKKAPHPSSHTSNKVLDLSY